jgi:hypothetical protein
MLPAVKESPKHRILTVGGGVEREREAAKSTMRATARSGVDGDDDGIMMRYSSLRYSRSKIFAKIIVVRR